MQITVTLEDNSTITRKRNGKWINGRWNWYINYKGKQCIVSGGSDGVYTIESTLNTRYVCKLGHNGDDCYSYGVWDSVELRWIGHPDSRMNIQSVVNRKNNPT